MNSNSIIDSIDIEKYNTIEMEREKIMGDEKFIQWCKDMNIGIRVEVKDYRAMDMNSQYSHNYPKWVQQKF